jgi:hypothetical protein
VSHETTPPARAPRTARPRRQRTLTESLLSIVLGLEAVLVFFIALTVFGLHALPPAVAFGGGAALAIVLALATRVVRWNWGVWVGWVLQLILLAAGLLLPALYIVAAVFIAMWVYCFVRARGIDRDNAARNESTASSEPQHP